MSHHADTQVQCGVMHPAFLFAYWDEDSHPAGLQPKKASDRGEHGAGVPASQGQLSRHVRELTGPEERELDTACSHSGVLVPQLSAHWSLGSSKYMPLRLLLYLT